MVQLTINNKTVDIHSPPETPLLWVLRCERHLTGTKFGCGIGVCGACTVLMNGKAQQSCQLTVGSLHGARITTIEGLDGPVARALREAWIELDVVQCGYCQSAQLIAADALLSRCPAPTTAQINDAMRDIACRCGTFPRILKAIRRAADTLCAPHRPA